MGLLSLGIGATKDTDCTHCSQGPIQNIASITYSITLTNSTISTERKYSLLLRRRVHIHCVATELLKVSSHVTRCLYNTSQLTPTMGFTESEGANDCLW